MSPRDLLTLWYKGKGTVLASRQGGWSWQGCWGITRLSTLFAGPRASSPIGGHLFWAAPP